MRFQDELLSLRGETEASSWDDGISLQESKVIPVITVKPSC